MGSLVRRYRQALGAAAVAWALVAAVEARAAVVVALDLKQLVVQADRIISGRVVGTDTHWMKGRIVTDARVLVDATQKGKHEREVIVRHLGGVVEGFGQKTWGAAELAVGEEVVLFLERRLGAYEAVGLAQGKFKVTRGPRGERTVARDIRELALQAQGPGGSQAQAVGALQIDKSGVMSKPRALDELVRDIELHVQATK